MQIIIGKMMHLELFMNHDCRVLKTECQIRFEERKFNNAANTMGKYACYMDRNVFQLKKMFCIMLLFGHLAAMKLRGVETVAILWSVISNNNLSTQLE